MGMTPTEFFDGPADGFQYIVPDGCDLYFFECVFKVDGDKDTRVRYIYQRDWQGKFQYRNWEQVSPT